MGIETWIITGLTLILGSGGIAALVKAYNDKVLGIATNETEARRDVSESWDQIVGRLEDSIERLTARQDESDKKIRALENELNQKTVVTLSMYGHIVKLETLVTPPIPPRPKEMEGFV